MIGVDSNLLVYASIRADDRRHERAVDVLHLLMQRQLLFMPLQVVAETFHVLVRKSRVDPAVAARAIDAYASFATVESYVHDDVRIAMEMVAQHRLSFWDALIWAVCQRSGVRTLLTEDMQDGRILGHVTFMNPFGEHAAHLLGH